VITLPCFLSSQTDGFLFRHHPPGSKDYLAKHPFMDFRHPYWMWEYEYGDQWGIMAIFPQLVPVI
jgi:hypothetical protein